MYNAKTAYNVYSRDKVLTASPVELIIMLYDEAIKQLKVAELAIEEKRYDKANTSLQKTQDIVDELTKCLDLNVSIGKDLLEIYEFVCKSIIKINATKDKEKIAPIIDILTDLREAWIGVKQKAGSMYAIEE